MATQPHQQFQAQPPYLSNGSNGPASGAQALLPNNGRVIQSGATRVLCVADVRGNLRSLNELAKAAKADHILHTGDFGFYDESSLDRIAEKTLKHVAQYSPLLNDGIKRQIAQSPPAQSIKGRFGPDNLPLSQLPQLLSKQFTLDVPVYTVWGACEDVRVLEKFRSGEYKIDKLHIIDEASSRLLDVGGIKLRLFGLGGAVVMHKLFDNGEGKTTIAGGQGTMWTTLLQMGELIDTANRVYDPAETRVFITHASPAREGMLNQLSVTLKADFSISAGLHFRYGSSYNEFSVNPTLDHYRGKLAASKASFQDVWETVRTEVEQAITQNDAQKTLLENALDIVTRMPTVANGGGPFGGPPGASGNAGQVDESAFKNMWNFNLADAAFGYLVLEIDGGRIGTEMRAQGFNFSHRAGGAAGGPAGKMGSVQQGPPQSQPQHPQGGSAPAPSGPAQHRGTAFAAPPQPFPQSQAQGPGPRPQQNPSTQSAAKPSTPTLSSPAPLAASTPAAPLAPANQTKPLTPQPSSTNVQLPGSGNDKGTAAAVNGTPDKSTEAPKPSSSPNVEKKPPTALYVLNAENEDQIRDLFPEEDKAKIKELKKFGKTAAFVLYFETHEDCKAAFERQPIEHKTRHKDPKIINLRYFEDRSATRTFHRDSQGGAGTWAGSSRGGAGPNTRGGYQSGTASDSEGGRGGRGGFRGGRGGRGRGGDDRGGRGGRGAARGGGPTKVTEGSSEPKPA